MADAKTKAHLADGKACLEAALKYNTLGWSSLCLCPADHVGVGRGHAKVCKSPGKVPIEPWKEFQDRRATVAELERLWRDYPNANVGLALGPVSNLVRVDIEGSDLEPVLQQLSQGDLPPTLEFRSGRKDGTGRGILYRIPAGIMVKTTYEGLGPKKEIRFQARGAQTVLPPSRHADGGRYEWLAGRSPLDLEPALAPGWVLEQLASKDRTTRAIEDWQVIYGGVNQGTRHNDALALIGRLIYGARDLRDANYLQGLFEIVRAWNERNEPPLPDDELQRMFADIVKSEAYQRQDADNNKMLEAKALVEIRQCLEMSGNGVDSGPAGTEPNGHNTARDKAWHLVIIQSEPTQYLLRCPWWASSPKLTNGYLPLKENEISEWAKIKDKAIRTVQVVPPPKFKRWNVPSGMLQSLFDGAEIVANPPPESRRGLFILGFIFRYLNTASDEEPTSLDSAYTVTRWEGGVVFKIQHLKRHVRLEKEDFHHDEVISVLSNQGFVPRIIANKRWWFASDKVLRKMGQLTQEKE